MTENQKEWLYKLYEGEIVETLGTIANERMWERGSPDIDIARMHSENIVELRQYIEILNKLKEDINVYS